MTIMDFIRCSDDTDELRKFYKGAANGLHISREAANLLNEFFDAKIDMNETEGASVNMCKGIEGLIAESVIEGQVSGFISASREFGKSDEEIVRLIMDKFSLTKEKAIEKVTNN